ncbi:MAG: right-handed parallel beta-helix repeat-containing protein, partial [Candidatus Thermoplasmatota archaeon]|nr:right-handed parallel beta-helix repeat-containing protein [Candidatus Thermoplasmatota archaeon]
SDKKTREDIDYLSIEGDLELFQTVFDQGWAGSGTSNDPYIIEDQIFDSTWEGCCVRIIDTAYHITIRNCTISGASDAYYTKPYSGAGISLEDVKNTVLDTCKFSDNDISGARIDGCSRVKITDSSFEGSNSGVKCTGSDLISLTTNRICNSSNGIYVHTSSWTTLSGNIISGCTANGMVFWESSNVSIYSNLLLSNNNYGITLLECEKICTTGNSFCHNRGAGDEYMSSISQVYDDSLDNSWFEWDGIGNHWRDLMGPDVDQDGIVDRNYKIDGAGVFDQRPLAVSPVPTIPSRPTMVELSQQAEGILFKWGPPLDNGTLPLSHYVVQRNIANGPFKSIANVPVDETETLDEDVVQGGCYVYRVIAMNSFGPSEPSKELSSIRDVVPPVINRIEPIPGTFITESSIQVKWEASDDQGKIWLYEIRIDNSSWMVIDDRTDQFFPSLSQGRHDIVLRAYDPSGNFNEMATYFTVDWCSPTCEVLSPERGEIVASSLVKMEFNISDDISGVLKSQISIDNGNWSDINMDQMDRTLMMQDGQHSIRINVEDRAGNTRTTTVDFTVDTVPPTIEIIQPERNLRTNRSNVLIRWSMFDATSGIENLLMSIDGSIRWIDVTRMSEYGLIDLKDGVHSICFSAVDRALHVTKTWLNFTVDTRPPKVIDHGPEGDNNLPTARVWTRFNEPVDKVIVSINGRIMNYMISESGTEINISSGGMLPGNQFHVTITAVDLLGNMMSPFKWDFWIVDPEDTMNGIITGRVLDENGLPIENALVRISYLDLTRTDSEGYFVFEIEPGHYNMSIECDGFESRVVFFNITGGKTTDIGERILKTHNIVEKENRDIPWTFILILTALLVIISITTLIVILFSRKRGKIDEEDGVEEERRKLYSVVEIPADLAEAFIKGPTAEEEDAMFSLAPEIGKEDIEGVINYDDLGSVYAPEIDLEDVKGLDLSILDDEIDEMDWSELANPLYEVEDTTRMEDMDCYRKLGVAKDADKKDIKKAYRRLATLYHPDRISRFDPVLKERAIEEMKRVNYAKEILLIDEKRTEYDRMCLESAKTPLQ